MENFTGFLKKRSTQLVANFKKEPVKMKYMVINSKYNQQIPAVGLGTWQAKPEEVEDAVSAALHVGYRHIDTAFNYNNEEAIGNALKRWIQNENGKRQELFITTKLPVFGNRPKDVERFLKMSLERLKLNYIDLYLIHMPFTVICDEKTLSPAVDIEGKFILDKDTDHLAIWKVLEGQVRKGLIKNIGLSNFNEKQIRKIYDNSMIKPAVLQVELHAYMQQRKLRKFCEEYEIIVTAYSPLGSPGAKDHFKNKYNYTLDAFPDILGHPNVIMLAEKYKRSPGQILLRHLVNHNIVVIPKSSNSKRIAENISIFDFQITEDDMKILDALDNGEAGRIFNFKFFKGIENHPEYPFKDICLCNE